MQHLVSKVVTIEKASSLGGMSVEVHVDRNAAPGGGDRGGGGGRVGRGRGDIGG